jgi:siroheme synthase (precorrin-2 oxidase/ferrochelatase)
MEIISATTDISKSTLRHEGKDVVIIGGGSGGFGKTQLLFNMERNEKSVLERLRGDVHMGDFVERPKGRASFRYLDTAVAGVPGAAKRRAKRKAEKKARKQSRK